MNKQKLSAPWYTFVRELTAMFANDPDVKTNYDSNSQNLNITVSKYEKAEALKKILPENKTWGNVNLKINVKYNFNSEAIEDTIKQAFEGNPAFKYVFSFKTGSNPITYVIFDKKVVQYWNDDLHDPHGVTSTLYENIARDIFNEKNGLVFSTDSDSENKVPYDPNNQKYQPTNEEVAIWEKYNGTGSYSNGSKLKCKGESINVKDEKTFKSIFNYKNTGIKNKTDEEFPF